MNVLQRLATGGALIALIVWVLFVAPLWVFGFVVIVFTGLALNEFFRMVEHKGIRIIEHWIGLAVGLLIPLSIYWQFEPTKGWELFFMVLAFLVLFILQLRRDSSQAIVGISTTLFGIFYISWCFSFLMKLRFIDGPGAPDGRWLVALVLLVTKGGDVGAYTIGSLFGRHRFIPKVSPSKTWEGAAGGLIFSLIAAVCLKPVLPGVPIGHLLTLGILLGVLGQLGDISESMLKRDSQVKDSGQILPGMGGVLDVLDSLLFTSPICYFYVQKFLI